MSTRSRSVLLLALGAALAVPAAAQEKQEKPKKATKTVPALPLIGGPAAPAQEPGENAAQKLEREFAEADQKVIQEYMAARNNKASDDELQKILQKRPDAAEYMGRFKEIAAANPGSDTAFDALKWLLPRDRSEGARAQTLHTLLATWANSPKMADIVPMLDGSDELDRKVLDHLMESPVREVKGVAAFLVAKAMADDPAQAEEAEVRLELIANEYADLAYRGRKLGDMAKGQLTEMRMLGIGKVAPDITGPDLDGVAFKLSDYRGKVIMLDFWGHW